MFLSLLDLAISLTISWRDSRSSPSPGSSFSCQFLVPSRGAIPCAGCLPLAVSPATRSSLAVPPALGELGPSFFIVVSCLLFSLWAPALLFMAPRPFCLRSFFTVLTFRPVVPPGWSPLGFLLLAPGSHSLCLFLPCVCTALGPSSSSFLLPSSLAASSLGVLCPLLPFYRSWSSLPGVMLPLSFHCHTFRGPLSIFGLVPHLSVVSFSVHGLILLCHLSPVFCRVLSPFGCMSVGGSSISSPLVSPSSWRLVFLHGSSPSRSPSSTASSGHLRLLLYLSWPSPSSAVLRFSVLSTSLVVVSFSLSPCLVAPWGFLLFAWDTVDFVLCSLRSLCRVASTFLFPFCNPSSYGLHPNISMSAFPGYCLFRSRALLFLSFCMGAWSTCLVPCPASPSLVSIPLSFLQVVSSCPSLGALLTRSNLHYTMRRGLPLGQVSS